MFVSIHLFEHNVLASQETNNLLRHHPQQQQGINHTGFFRLHVCSSVHLSRGRSPSLLSLGLYSDTDLARRVSPFVNKRYVHLQFQYATL